MKVNHWLIPIGIAGVVVTIWAALRKTGNNPTVVVERNPSLATGVTPIGAPATVPYAGVPDSSLSTQTVVPGTSASGVPNYSGQTSFAAGGDPQPAPFPGRQGGLYGPIQSFIRSMVPVSDLDLAADTGKSCGCGGSCGGGCPSNCQKPCSGNNSRYTDGAGACLMMNRQQQIKQAIDANPRQFKAASDNIMSSDLAIFDVFQQTVYDLHAKFNNAGDTPPASPFLSPV